MKIGYIRVSDHEQTENLQIDALNAAHCDVIYSDHGVSGSITERKGLSDVFSALKKGDTLIVWKIDRLGRSTIHLLMMLDELRKKGIDFIAITQGIDTTTAIGRMVFGQLAVFAEFEREQIRERTKAGMQAAKKRGVHIGRPKKMTTRQIANAAKLIRSKTESISDIALKYNVTPKTLSRALKKLKCKL